LQRQQRHQPAADDVLRLALSSESFEAQHNVPAVCSRTLTHRRAKRMPRQSRARARPGVASSRELLIWAPPGLQVICSHDVSGGRAAVLYPACCAGREACRP
jgi:hypothetical protein